MQNAGIDQNNINKNKHWRINPNQNTFDDILCILGVPWDLVIQATIWQGYSSTGIDTLDSQSINQTILYDNEAVCTHWLLTLIASV